MPTFSCRSSSDQQFSGSEASDCMCTLGNLMASDRNDMDKEPVAESPRGIFEAPSFASAWRSLSLTQLREKARNTPGISEKKKLKVDGFQKTKTS